MPDCHRFENTHRTSALNGTANGSGLVIPAPHQVRDKLQQESSLFGRLFSLKFLYNLAIIITAVYFEMAIESHITGDKKLKILTALGGNVYLWDEQFKHQPIYDGCSEARTSLWDSIKPPGVRIVDARLSL